MNSKPILFQGAMVRALLDGTKTQTRRVVKPQFANDAEPAEMGATNERGHQISGHSGMWWDDCAGNPEAAVRCPYGKPGDQLWVREAWSEPTSLDPGPTFYRADYPACVPPQFGNVPPVESIKWKPSIHMRRDQCRITLEITSVRVERLQDISEADALAEGVLPGGFEYDNGEGTETAKESYECLWKQINGPDSWEANPWVWVVEFKVIKP